MFQRHKKDSDSDDEDYRKGYMKARKDQKTNTAAPPDFDNLDTAKFGELFAKQLFEQRGLQVSEQEMGIKQQEQKKNKKAASFVPGAPSTLQELQRELVKAGTNIPQVSTVLKDIIALQSVPGDLRIYYTVLRCEILVKNRQFMDVISLGNLMLKEQLNIIDRVRVLLSLSNAQQGLGQLWNAQIQILRIQSYIREMIEFDMSIRTIIYTQYILVPMVSPFDPILNDIVNQIEDSQLAIRVKTSKEKKTLSQLMSQGTSAQGALGLGEDIQELPEPQIIPLLRGRIVLSLSCGDHHVLALVMGCSCADPWEPSFDCGGGATCNQGSEVMGWGENFLGQAVGCASTENFISTPTVVSALSGKAIVGVMARRAVSMAWSESGSVYEWGREVRERKDLKMKNIVQICIGLTFIAILDMNKQVYVQGGFQTSLSTKPMVYFEKCKKLELKNIIQISVGDYHLLAMDEEGNSYGMGSNEYAQLGFKTSESLFHPKIIQLDRVDQVRFIQAQGNLSMVITLEGELLYMGQLTVLKHIDYPKTAQLPDDQSLIQVNSYGGILYALTKNGMIYSWDPDNQPKFKLFKEGLYRELQLGRGIRILRNTLVRASYCSLSIDESELCTLTDIIVQLTLKDEFGLYSIPLSHHIRLHYFLTKKTNRKLDEILQQSHATTLKEFKKSQQQIQTTKIFDDDQGSLLSLRIISNPLDSAIQNITLQIRDSGTYYLYLLLNEEQIDRVPLELVVGKSEKEFEMAEQIKKEQELRIEREQEIRQKLMDKKKQEEENIKNAKQKEDLIEQKRKETQMRADETLKSHHRELEQKIRREEDERKVKKELMTGGGFDLNKARLIQQQNVENQLNGNQIKVEKPQYPPFQKVQQKQQLSKPDVVQARILSPKTSSHISQQNAQLQNQNSKQQQQNFIQQSKIIQNPQEIQTTLKQFQTTTDSKSLNNRQFIENKAKPTSVSIGPTQRDQYARFQAKTISKHQQLPALNLLKSAVIVPSQDNLKPQRFNQTQGQFGGIRQVMKLNDLMFKTEIKINPRQQVAIQNMADPFALQQQALSRSPSIVFKQTSRKQQYQKFKK